MISAFFKKGELHLISYTAKDSAELATWLASDNPVIIHNEFWGGPEEPCESEVHEGGLHLSQTGYVTRALCDSIWNRNILHK